MISTTRKENIVSTNKTFINRHPVLSYFAMAGGVRDWQRWAPYATMAWSLVYAALGLYWVVSERGFPYAPGLESGVTGPVVGRFGPTVAWIIVITAGLPAAVMGTAMLRGVRSRVLRPLFITTGALLAGVLLMLMTDLTLLVMLAYIPFVVFRLLTGADIGFYLQELTQSQRIIAHQLLCLIGGFLWLAATVSYARRSGDACLYCGRRDGPDGWTSPFKAARWGRIAVYVAMVVPVFYAVTRYAWALGFPLGMSEESLRLGQEHGIWTSGLFLATLVRRDLSLEHQPCPHNPQFASTLFRAARSHPSDDRLGALQQ
jgi:hypothetical protein